MASSFRKWIFLLALFLPLVLVAQEGETEDEDSFDESSFDEEYLGPLPSLRLNLQDEIPDWKPPYDPLGLHISPGEFRWSSYRLHWEFGNHSLENSGGMYLYGDTPAFGDDFQLGRMGTTLTYRYNGLFGGIIRPVARVTTGMNQRMDPLGGFGLTGYQDYWTGALSAEAGLEFVVNGYGLGVVAGYQWTMDIDWVTVDDKHTMGPFSPDPNSGNMEHWYVRPYLIWK